MNTPRHAIDACKMVRDITSKHIGDIDYLLLDWVVIELYDRNGETYQQLLPNLTIDFKC